MTRRLVCLAPNPSIDRFVEVDRLVPGTIHRPTRVQAVAGGKGLNVARAAVALGGSVIAVGIVAGHGGRWVVETLAAGGVDGRFVWSDGETRICTSIADASTGTLTELYEAGPAVGEGTWDAFESETRAALGSGDASVVTLSGSLPPGAPAYGHMRLVEIARAAGVPLAVDGFGPSGDAATAWRALLAAGPWLVKANLLEASGFAGEPLTDAAGATAAARAMVEAGTGGAVITLGAAGAVACLRGATWRIGPPRDLGPYPVGSGDAFLAGLVVGTTEGLDTAARLALAAGAGAANAAIPGAGRFDGAVARSIARSISVERLD